MKKLFIFIFLFFLTSSIFAGGIDYSAIVPGVTTREQILKILGEPLEEIVPDSIYRYRSEHYAIKYIDVGYVRTANRVKYFSIFFNNEKIYSDDVKVLFNLIKPVKKLYGLDGNVIEVYFPESILVRYGSTGTNSAVERVDVLETKLAEGYSRWSDVEDGAIHIYGLNAKVKNVEHKGVQVTEITPAGAADKAGLLIGDIIFEVEDFIFGAEYNLEPFRSTMSLMPVDQPLMLLIARRELKEGGVRKDKKMTLSVSLQPLSEEDWQIVLSRQVERMRKDKDRQLLPLRDYDSGVLQMSVKKTTEEILPFVDLESRCDFDLFTQTIASERMIDDDIFRIFPGILVESEEYNVPGDPNLKFDYKADDDITFLITGATLFIKSGHYRQALENFVSILNSNPKDPLVNYATAFCFDKLGDRVNAMFYYHKAQSFYADNQLVVEYIKGRLFNLNLKG